MAYIEKLSSGHWRAQIRIKGHPFVSLTRRTKAACERAAREVEDGMRNGTYRDRSAAESRLLSDHLDWYLEAISAQKAGSSLPKERSRVKLLKEHPAFKRRTIATVTPQCVLDFIEERKAAGIAPATVKSDLAVLRHAIEAGDKLLRLHLPHGNPVAEAMGTIRFTKALVVDNARERRISPGEEAAVLDAMESPVMRGAVVLLIETGMRRKEACRARREHIAGATLRIPEAKAKGGRTGARTIPLSPRALETIAALPERIDGLLLGLRPDSVTQAFARACKRAGIEDMRVHDCRHEFISRRFEAGWSIAEVAACSGHADWRSLARYTNLRPEDLAEKLAGNR